uniref:AlNc14C114G6478 protein n=1 Tax=Albugo laibachii Nc14 TaxID=890382 RepID=F0WIU3_9STRA|nr:AlNc14C114G6478 [Albugo laibachii Nc14]|eukprot:CCA21187.1 AlNc14C114G6478 [Albugo laibachii Nc14]
MGLCSEKCTLDTTFPQKLYYFPDFHSLEPLSSDEFIWVFCGDIHEPSVYNKKRSSQDSSNANELDGINGSHAAMADDGMANVNYDTCIRILETFAQIIATSGQSKVRYYKDMVSHKLYRHF